MDKNVLQSLNLMEIDVVKVKGKIAGIKDPIEIVMDSTTFNEWKGKLEAPEKKKMGFGQAFMSEAKRLAIQKKK